MWIIKWYNIKVYSDKLNVDNLRMHTVSCKNITQRGTAKSQ